MGKKPDKEKHKAKGGEKGKKPVHGWVQSEVDMLIDILVQEVHIVLNKKGHLDGYTRDWGRVSEKINASRIGDIPISKSSCKNKHDNLRKNWRIWKRLSTHETGLGRIPTSGKVDASDDWKVQKNQENPDVVKFMNSKFPHHLLSKMEQLWGQSYATGDLKLAPGGSSRRASNTNSLSADDSDEDADDNVELPSFHIPSAQVTYNDAFASGSEVNMSTSGGENSMDFSGPFSTGLDGPPSTGVFGASSSVAMGSAVAGGPSMFGASLLGATSGSIAPGGCGQQPINCDSEDANYWLDIAAQIKGKSIKGPSSMKGKSKLSPSIDLSKGKRKSKGSKESKAMEIQMITTNYNNEAKSTLTSAQEMIIDLQASMRAQRANIISVREAMERLRCVSDLNEDELAFAFTAIKDEGNREVFQNLQSDEEVGRWLRHMHFSVYGRNV